MSEEQSPEEIEAEIRRLKRRLREARKPKGERTGGGLLVADVRLVTKFLPIGYRLDTCQGATLYGPDVMGLAVREDDPTWQVIVILAKQLAEAETTLREWERELSAPSRSTASSSPRHSP